MPRITTIRHQGKKVRPTQEPVNIAPSLDSKRVAAYCRVSTLCEEQGMSFEAQQKYYKALFENDPKHILVHVYGDQGITGTSVKKRPGFMDMYRDCKHGRIDEIYTKSISRFARNFSECLEYVRELKQMGIVIYFEKEKFSTADPNIEMILSMMAIMAQEESNSISQNITLAHEYYNKKGDPIMRARYGYRRDKKATDGVHKWRIVKEEAMMVRLCFKLYLAGNTIESVAKILNDYEKEHPAAGIPTASNTVDNGAGKPVDNGADKPVDNGADKPADKAADKPADKGADKLATRRPRHWTSLNVAATLKHEAYVGDIITNKTYTVDYLTHKCKRNNGERKQYYIRDHHPAIISREVFAKAHEILGRELPECMRQK